MNKKSIKQHKIRINKKILIVICLVVISIFPFVPTFSRYAINGLKEFFYRSKEFYFYSDKLGENNPSFLIDNWPGVDDYSIIVNMNSMKNNILGASYDIDYNISYTCSSNADCTLSKTSGTILAETNTDFFTLTVTPNTQLNTGDEVRVSITAVADSYYNKTITGEFILRVGKENITYSIDDEKGSPYLEVNITNTQSYYIVDQAFGTYNVNDRIKTDDYLQLSDQNKAKCHSAIITLQFNPRDIVLDMTNANYLNATDVKSTILNTYTYINEITFKVDAISSSTVRFYKTDVDLDYTYPNSNNLSVVTFSSR